MRGIMYTLSSCVVEIPLSDRPASFQFQSIETQFLWAGKGAWPDNAVLLGGFVLTWALKVGCGTFENSYVGKNVSPLVIRDLI